ncbi:formimidoylglutamate deiminase [Mesorhizobium sp. NBSH29]|uniref:formimidoylglutamate deiminase n=1 Tax=Mesorhizobium sp. NBSH29 TaxID=2654249 RepID=UPI0018968A9F|nr:formimidoylglutamate deiminase [Mesorhizobium sp. NBSH29]QPC86907.1 formimidoylglutamate deiminase [Mesorhizobium sp. NBSH29]
MSAIFAQQALLPEGWRNNVRICFEDGRVSQITPDTDAQKGDETHAILLESMPNLHSHAFQRGMAGLAETRGPGSDSFWSWREVMYRFALTMSPDQMEAVAAQLYVEMLEAGFSRVGEFHYLHHDCNGQAYDNIAEMAQRIASAAQDTGIALTLLPVFYAHSGFGGTAPGAGQRRFINDLDQFARLYEGCQAAISDTANSVLGVAPHSLRAVTPAELEQIVALADGGPIHIHIAEQKKEVADCIAWSGARPVEWLLDHAEVNSDWCLIHATHMNPLETKGFALSGAVAGLCPITEANLGDGTFSAPEFLSHGGAFGIGSDSNVQIGVVDELRQLEYSQRLLLNQRNVLAHFGETTGRNLFTNALAGGKQALGAGKSGLNAGGSADFVTLDGDHPTFAAKSGDQILDAWIFSGARAVDCVWVGGKKLVEGGRHFSRDRIAAKFRATMRDLAAT